MNITQKPSPNFDSNRQPIDRIVIHWMVTTLAGADAQFMKPGGTSAHYGIEDAVIHQYVAENKVAYHAGNYPMNQRSIGIEHSADPNRPASDTTYQTSGQLIAEIAKRYNIPLDRQHIIKHSEVVATQCCGTVDVDRLISIAKAVNNSPNPMDRRPYWFDLMNKAIWGGVAWESLKDADIEKFVKEYPFQRRGNGEWGKIVDKAYNAPTDSTVKECNQVYQKIQSQSPLSKESYNKALDESKASIEKLRKV